jgi:hypothetical protein
MFATGPRNGRVSPLPAEVKLSQRMPPGFNERCKRINQRTEGPLSTQSDKTTTIERIVAVAIGLSMPRRG